MTLVTAVRPYAPRIRVRVFELFGRAGCTILPDHVIPPGTSDLEAVVATLAHANRVLLVPFHGHQDKLGNRVDGIGFLRQLDRAAKGQFEWRVVMPVSAFAVPAVNGMLARRELPDRVQEKILVIREDELDLPDIADRIRAHVVI